MFLSREIPETERGIAVIIGDRQQQVSSGRVMLDFADPVHLGI